jgi:PPOX class probable F420-dependent enzyme
MKALPLATLYALLDAMPVARLALNDLDGLPEALPIVFARVDDSLWSPIDGKPKGPAGAMGRLARLAHSPKVMLVLDHYTEDWSDLWWLRLRAEAEIIVGKHPEWLPAVDALAAKYPQYQVTPMLKDEPTMLRFTWQAINWWGARGKEGIEDWLRAETR